MELIIGRGEEQDPTALRLSTRQGNHIPNERRLEQPPEVLKAAVAIHSQEHPDARLRSITAVYNCMGLIFASRRTWIDTTSLMMILQADGYKRVSELSELQPGDVVVYRNHDEVSYVAVVLAMKPEIVTASWKITVISKWGGDGEYIHDIKDVPPLYGQPVEFWTDRRPEP
jgi:hypothetical protein